MNTADVEQALYKRWPASEHVLIAEAPLDPQLAGRRIDLLVISKWSSRGFQREAVEIKVSYSDWKKELQSPRKAEDWYKHCHRFWVAAPSELAKKIKPELPDTWGLLSVSETGTRELVKAPKHQPEDFTSLEWLGLVRAAQGTTNNIISSAEWRGRELGRKEAEERYARQQSHTDEGKYLALKARVDAFEESAGFSIGSDWYDIQDFAAIGQLVAALADPVARGRLVVQMKRAKQTAEGSVAELAKAIATVDSLLEVKA